MPSWPLLISFTVQNPINIIQIAKINQKTLLWRFNSSFLAHIQFKIYIFIYIFIHGLMDML